ncbi:MAG: hypothetical protein J3R72DRAFT_426697 [Linnemannia gamsii]|nr:MAG: hypothetical protein J3R72DRAFT_426697 [Linnemannia gamsii]
MVHCRLQKYFAEHPDLPACSHFDFFDEAPELEETDACAVWITGLTALAKDSDPTTGASLTLLRERYYDDKKNGTLKQYWSNRRVEQEVGRSEQAARVQTAITVNRTTARVLHSVERNAVDCLDKFDDTISQDDESSSRAAARTSIAPLSSSLPLSLTPNLKKRKRSTKNGGSTSTTTEINEEPNLSSRKEPALEDPNNPFIVQAHAAETEFYESELESSTQGRVRSAAMTTAEAPARALVALVGLHKSLNSLVRI